MLLIKQVFTLKINTLFKCWEIVQNPRGLCLVCRIIQIVQIARYRIIHILMKKKQILS